MSDSSNLYLGALNVSLNNKPSDAADLQALHDNFLNAFIEMLGCSDDMNSLSPQYVKTILETVRFLSEAAKQAAAALDAGGDISYQRLTMVSESLIERCLSSAKASPDSRVRAWFPHQAMGIFETWVVLTQNTAGWRESDAEMLGGLVQQVRDAGFADAGGEK